MRIALLGAESTGKTELATALVHALNNPAGSAVAVPEFLRDWCATHSRTPQAHEQWPIARQQALAIADLPDPGTTIADTTPLMTAIYSDLLFQDHSLYPFALQHHALYDLTLVMGLDLPWIADGFQRDGPTVRARVDARLRQVLQTNAIPFCTVYGSGAVRTKSALQAIAHRRGLASGTAASRTNTWQWNCEKCSDARCEHQLFSSLIKGGSVRH